MAQRHLSAEWRHGWRIVAGAAMGMGTGISLYLLVMSLFITEIAGANGWTRGDMGVAGTIAFGSGALALPVLGRLVDRLGFRRVVLVCTPALALVYVSIATQPGIYGVHLLLAACGGIVGAGTGGIPYTRPVIAAFDRHRGLALGVATAGTSLTAVAVPPMLVEVISRYGWRAGLYGLATLTALIGLPAALLLIGRTTSSGCRVHDGTRTGETTAPDHGTSLRDALRRPRFWCLALALVAINIPGSGVVSQLAPLLADKGIPARGVALVMSIYAVGLLVGRLVTGLALDRLSAPAVAATVTSVAAVGAALLLLPTSSFAVAALAVGLFGLQQGSEVDLIAYFVSRGFGAAAYGAIYGAIGMAGASATAFALLFFGKVHDRTGSYDIALRIGMAAFCVGALALAAIGWIRDTPGDSPHFRHI